MQHSSGSTDHVSLTPEETAGQQLRHLRIARGWSQEQVAERMKAYGYDWHQTLVGRIEAAQRPLRLNEAVHLAALFEVPAETLLRSEPDAEADTDTLNAQLERTRDRADAAAAAFEEIQSRLHRTRAELASLEDEEGRAQAALYSARQDLAKLSEARERAYRRSVDHIQSWLRAQERNDPEASS